MPEDGPAGARALKAIVVARKSGAAGWLNDQRDYLGYLMPVDYIRQGMIADTGSEHHLSKKHHTLTLIIDWVIHPFSHLRQSPLARMAGHRGVDPALARRHPCPLGIDDPQFKCDQCPYRRVILVEVRRRSPGHFAGKSLLDIDTTRVPVGFTDIDTRTGRVVRLKKGQSPDRLEQRAHAGHVAYTPETLTGPRDMSFLHPVVKPGKVEVAEDRPPQTPRYFSRASRSATNWSGSDWCTTRPF